MAQITITLTLLAALLMLQGVSAKRGCSAFGHSCFGGHGKRSGDTNNIDSSNPELMMQRQMGQEETPPHPGYPHSGFSGLLPAGDDIIPVRDGGIYDPENSAAAREVMKFKLRNIVKHWMDNYRRAQPNNDEGYFAETL
ncbi:neuropeptide CCHamide-2 [Cydia fagiglandana]|uniref:neuropeptide CCHamide-2 n=1 Tax=Cydia fagiglandana TaxID=1458189 RepID=UPI002FEE19B6